MSTYNKDRCVQHGHAATLPQLCETCQRMDVERKIVEYAVDVLLRRGYTLRVQGSMDAEDRYTTNRDEILNDLRNTDDDYLVVQSGKDTELQVDGWLRFIYGNSGWDVLNDYTTNLENTIASVNDYARTFEV